MLSMLAFALTAGTTALLNVGSSPTGRRTAKGRRFEIDGAAAGEGGALGRLQREAWARTLPRPPATVLEITTAKFTREYDDVEINALWDAVRRCYGEDALAVEAVRRNPYLLNPSYTWPPPLLSRSKSALVDVLGSEEETIQVMMRNPAVLQCGAPGILELGSGEIKLFANLRFYGSQVPPAIAAASGVGLGGLILLSIFGAAMDAKSQAQLEPLLAIAKPLLGLVFALAIEGSRVAIVGSVVQGQMRKRDAAAAAATEQLKAARTVSAADRRAESGWAKLAQSILGVERSQR